MGACASSLPITSFLLVLFLLLDIGLGVAAMNGVAHNLGGGHPSGGLLASRSPLCLRRSLSPGGLPPVRAAGPSFTFWVSEHPSLNGGCVPTRFGKGLSEFCITLVGLSVMSTSAFLSSLAPLGSEVRGRRWDRNEQAYFARVGTLSVLVRHPD